MDGGPDGGGFAVVGVEGMKVGGMGKDSRRIGTGCLRGRGGVVSILSKRTNGAQAENQPAPAEIGRAHV